MSEESHQPFQVLRRRRQEELLGDIPEPPQAHAAQTEALLELREQGFDLAAEALGAGISWRSGQRPYCLAGRFLPMHEQPAIGRGGTASLLRTALALRRRRAVGVTLTVAAPTAIAQRFSFGAVVDVLRWFVTELVAGEVSTGLMATIDDGDVRLHSSSQ